MKHPFYTLYYTGLSIFISLLLVCGLVIFNISNIFHLKQKQQNPLIPDTTVSLLTEEEPKIKDKGPEKIKNVSKTSTIIVLKEVVDTTKMTVKNETNSDTEQSKDTTLKTL